MELRDEVVLVTGANGFVGSRVARRLREAGLRVRGLYRRPEARAELERLGVEPVQGDVTDAPALRAAMEGVRFVVHCAAKGSPDLEESRRVNVEGTVRVLEAARAAGCARFVHISTMAVYERLSRDVVDEDTPLVTQGSPYAVTKADAERAVFDAMAHGLPAVILRPPCVLGAHPTSTWGEKVPRAILAGQYALGGDGSGHMGYVHVDNLAEAVVRALRTEAAVGQAFNIVDGHVTWRHYADAFTREPLPSLPLEESPPHFRFKGSFSHAKAVRVLGYAPWHSYEEALREIHQWLAAR